MILVARPGPAAGDEAFGIKSADHTGFTVPPWRSRWPFFWLPVGRSGPGDQHDDAFVPAHCEVRPIRGFGVVSTRVP
jgi:hypothetical protein